MEASTVRDHDLFVMRLDTLDLTEIMTSGATESQYDRGYVLAQEMYGVLLGEPEEQMNPRGFWLSIIWFTARLAEYVFFHEGFKGVLPEPGRIHRRTLGHILGITGRLENEEDMKEMIRYHRSITDLYCDRYPVADEDSTVVLAIAISTLIVNYIEQRETMDILKRMKPEVDKSKMN